MGVGGALLQEGVGTDDALNDRRQRVLVFRRATDHGPHLRHVEVFQLTVDRVHHQLLGERLRELRRVAGQILAQFGRAVDGEAARQHRAGVDRLIRRLAVDGAELSDGVEVLQGQSHRIDHAMALPARGVGAVLLQTRANRRRLLTRALREIAFHAGRRRRRRRADDLFEHPGAAQHGRGAIRIGRLHQDRALAEQSQTVPVGQRHPPELRRR